MRFLLLAMASAAILAAQSPGYFTLTGEMSVPRVSHTATLLPDGRVLIAGGIGWKPSSSVVYASAELYNPITGTFMPTGDMNVPRSDHSATLLPNGKVLIVGGSWGRTSFGDAELYDPAEGSFRMTTGELSAIRGSNTAILLDNGTVLIIAGLLAEIYDPDTESFRRVRPFSATLGICPICPPPVLLADGRVLLSSTRPALLFDFVREAFLPASGNSDLSTATLLANGNVLLSGGLSPGFDLVNDFGGRLRSAELFDREELRFASTGAMNRVRGWHSVTLLPNGTALVAGGSTDDCAFICSILPNDVKAEIYDPAWGSFADTGDLLVPVGSHKATVLNDGRVLITGGDVFRGIGLWDGSTASAELYTPAATLPAPLVYALAGGQGAVLHSGTARIVSAAAPAAAGDYLEVYAMGLLPGAVIPPRITVGGRAAEVLFFGPSGYENLYQINIRMPSDVVPGTAPLRLSYMGRFSNEVKISAW